MAERVRAVAVKVEPLDLTTGLWCNTCMRATGVRMWVAVISRHGMHLQERLWCYDHEGSRGVVVEQ